MEQRLPPLAGIRVLDLSHALAGPFCTLMLANYGAEVYKLETPDGGDIGRGWAPPFQGGHAAYFLALNAHKKGLSVDLKQPRGVEIALKLIEQVDVLIENLRPGTLERLGLGWDAARARNSRLVYCSISGYGQNGPRKDEPAMDLILQAASGLISITGTENGELVRSGYSAADITAGTFAVIGILMALRTRDRDGRGQFIDVSMFDTMIASMISNYSAYLGSGTVPGPLGTAFTSLVPYQVFHTADQDLAVAAGTEKLWKAFCEAIAEPELAAHPDYTSNALRVLHRRTLVPRLAEIFRQRTCKEWMSRLEAAGVPCSPVDSLRDVVEDPHSAAREMFVRTRHPEAGEITSMGAPVKFSDTPGHVGPPAPLLGEHTFEVLANLLGYDRAKLEALARDGAIVQARPPHAPVSSTKPALR
jgi:crotonobetainyl-CoA:carnitine CoA-transferase CaiB-like acyl-CoA transferase